MSRQHVKKSENRVEAIAMKTKRTKILFFCIFFITGILVIGAMTGNSTVVKAASKKVVKVTHKYKLKDGGMKRKVTLYGKAKDGTTVWKFFSPYLVCTELSDNEYFINKNTVYLFSDKLYAINKATGKVKWTYKNAPYSPAVSFDKKGNIYYTGWYSDDLIGLSLKGKVKFKTKLPARYMWPGKVKVASEKIKVSVVTADEEQIDYELVYDKKGNLLSERISI